MTPEEKTQQEKDAVTAMKAAQSNMTKALSRIQELEINLKYLADRMDEAAKMISGYPYNSTTSYRDNFTKAANDARKIL